MVEIAAKMALNHVVKPMVTEVVMPYVQDKLKEKISPKELLTNSKSLGISGNIGEVRGIQSEVENFTVKNFLPKEGGEWSGEIGNSTWNPNRDEIPKRPQGNEETWGEILDKHDIEGIEFKDGKPDFSTVSEGTVEIDDFSTHRNSNFTQADEQLAEKWTSEGKNGQTWSPQDIKEYRKENNLSWHERSDMQTIDLVPQEVHGNIPHSGGISAAKNKNN